MMHRKMLVLIFFLLIVAATASVCAEEGKKDNVSPLAQNPTDSSGANDRKGIPKQVSSEHWAYGEVAQLMEKYGAEKKLPEDRPCAKEELVDGFIAALVRVVEKYDKEGGQAISRDDLASIRTLVTALEDELFRVNAYREIRRTIEQLLALVEPPVPVFKYKLGVNGFLRGEAVSNFRLPDSSFSPDHDEGRFLYRVKPFAYWHPNNYLDIHLEGQGYGFAGGSQDSGEYSLYQGFVEAKIPRKDYPGINSVALKVGRQDFNYGSAFILGSDTFFNGLSFDAARLRVQLSLPWLSFLRLDLLGGKYATRFSDGIKGGLAGGYLSYEPSQDSTIEAYVFRDTGSEERRTGEHVNTLGYRSTSSVGIFALEHELSYQIGKVFNADNEANDNISAIGGHIDLTGSFPLRALGKSFDSSVFMSFALGSGDRNAANGIGSNSREFRNPNNDSSLVGDMSVVGDLSGLDVGDHHASGLQVYSLGWGIDLTKKINFSATGRKFVANKVEEGFSRDVGLETDFTLTYGKNKDFTFILGYDRFFTGQFFRDASGSDKNIDYLYAMVVFNYDWTWRKR